MKTYAKRDKKNEDPIARPSWPTKRPRQSLVLQKDPNDEKINLDDLSQYKVVSHKFEVDILCDKIRNDADLTRFKRLHYEKLGKEDKAKIEKPCMIWCLPLRLPL